MYNILHLCNYCFTVKNVKDDHIYGWHCEDCKPIYAGKVPGLDELLHEKGLSDCNYTDKEREILRKIKARH